jgi:hypothetical protein
LKDEFNATPKIPSPLTPDQAEAQTLEVELSQGYIANVKLALSMVNEFAHIDVEAFS